MKTGNIIKHNSWTFSIAIALAITVWMLSGQLGGDDEQSAAEQARTLEIPRNAVRVRTQTAEEVMRTIIVNGKTAPARIVHLASQTDGRIDFIGADINDHNAFLQPVTFDHFCPTYRRNQDIRLADDAR